MYFLILDTFRKIWNNTSTETHVLWLSEVLITMYLLYNSWKSTTALSSDTLRRQGILTPKSTKSPKLWTWVGKVNVLYFWVFTELHCFAISWIRLFSDHPEVSQPRKKDLCELHTGPTASVSKTSFIEGRVHQLDLLCRLK